MLCIIGFDNNPFLKDFIRIHVECLPQQKLVIDGRYPNYTFHGNNIRKQYQQHWFLRRAQSLLPYAFVHRQRTNLDQSQTNIVNSLRKFFKSHKVSVILAEFGETGAEIAPLAKKLNIPLLVHFHGHDAHRKSLLTEEMLASYREMFNSATAVFAVSRMMCQTLSDMGCPKTKIIYNPYGPRPKFFEITPTYEKTVLSVGRFTDIKANYLVLMAFELAKREVSDAKLVMVGDGELLETCKNLAIALKLENSVIFKGSISHSEVHKYFEKSCCFVQHSITPTYGDGEGTPNTILEASAASLPVVATRHAGIPDIIVNQETGYLVEERDIQGMARCIVKLLEDPTLCKRMGLKGRDRISKHFTTANHLNRLSKTIELAQKSNYDEIASLASRSQSRDLAANGEN